MAYRQEDTLGLAFVGHDDDAGTGVCRRVVKPAQVEFDVGVGMLLKGPEEVHRGQDRFPGPEHGDLIVLRGAVAVQQYRPPALVPSGRWKPQPGAASRSWLRTGPSEGVCPPEFSDPAGPF